METDHHGSGIFGAKTLLHDIRPQPSSSTVFGNLFQKIKMRIKEKREPRTESIHIQTSLKCRLYVSHPVCQRKSHFLDRSRTCFPDMVPADTDGIPERNLFRTERKDIGNDSHGRFWRKDIRPSRRIFFQDIVLNRTSQLVGRNPLLFTNGHIHGKQYRGRRIDGHGGADLVEGNLIKKDFHIPQRINGHSHFPHLSYGHFIVRIVPDLRGEIKSHGQSCLALIQQKPVSVVGFFCSSKTRILAHGPVSTPVHGWLNPSGIGVFPRKSNLFQVIISLQVERRIDATDGDTGSIYKFRFPFRALGHVLFNPFRPLRKNFLQNLMNLFF